MNPLYRQKSARRAVGFQKVGFEFFLSEKKALSLAIIIPLAIIAVAAFAQACVL